MNVSRLLVIFFIFNAQLFAQDPNTQLMEAIKNGSKSKVQNALNLGADINYIDSKTHDTPAFYALVCALETIIYSVDDYAYRLYANKNLKSYETVCGLALVPIFIGAFLIGEKTGWLKETKAGEFPYFAVLAPVASLGTCYALAQLPRLNFARTVQERIEIAQYLLERDNLNIQHKHQIYQKTISQLLDSLLAPDSGWCINKCLCRNGIPIDDPISSYPAVRIELANGHAMYLTTYTDRLMPVIKKIRVALKTRSKKSTSLKKTI